MAGEAAIGILGGRKYAGAPQVRVSNAAGQSCANGGFTLLTFAAEDYDDVGMHAASGSALVAARAGLHTVMALVQAPAALAAGSWYVYVRLNGLDTYSIAPTTGGASIADTCLVACQVRLAAGGTVELVVLNGSGAARTMKTQYFALAWEAP